MNQWDTYQWQFPHGVHPCVIISPQGRCTEPNLETVNVLGCSSHRTQRVPGKNEVLLDTSDGLSWETLCRLDCFWLAEKKDLRRRLGAVCYERRREIGLKIIKLWGLHLA